MSEGRKNKTINSGLTIFEKVVFAVVLVVAGYAFYSAAVVLLDAA